MAGFAKVDLGGGVYKKRPNRNAHRAIILAKHGGRWVFQHLFAKKDQENISASDLFARHLNTSVSTVQKWETGEKRPSGMALKLLSVVEKHGVQVLAA